MKVKGNKMKGLAKQRHAFFYLMVVLVFAFILANVLPSGSFVRETVDGVTKVDPSSYQVTENQHALTFVDNDDGTFGNDIVIIS